MSNTDSGWRKRQIALDIKAENARELGLDYEPSKTIEMAREAGFSSHHNPDLYDCLVASYEAIERFSELVRAAEREACALAAEKESLRGLPEEQPDGEELLRACAQIVGGVLIAAAIRARGDKHD